MSVKAKAPTEQCCDECGRDTRFGSGLFVNRIPADVGYICPDCASLECDRCNEKIEVDEDILLDSSFGHAQALDGAYRVHEACLSVAEKNIEEKREQ